MANEASIPARGGPPDRRRFGENLFRAAEGYALCAGEIKPAAPEHMFSRDDSELQQRYAEHAVALLERARVARYFNRTESITA